MRRRCCLSALQCAHTLKAPCHTGHSLIPVYPIPRSHLLPTLGHYNKPRFYPCYFYHTPLCSPKRAASTTTQYSIRLQAASCLPEVQDSRPLPPSTQLSPVHVPTRWPAYTCLHLPTPAYTSLAAYTSPVAPILATSPVQDLPLHQS